MKACTPVLFLLPLLASSPSAHAADADQLHVIRPILHAERDHAELCLEFDHALDAAGNAGRLASLFHVTTDGKPLAVSSRMLSLAGDQLCLSPLEHRRTYHLALDSLRDAKGERLSRSYNLSFSVPARRATLSLINHDDHDGVMVWNATPTLHSVNSGKVSLELFRITDPAAMAEAWEQRMQTTLAPSESLYFARDKGASVWKGSLTPDDAPDSGVESKIDLMPENGKDFPSGLYLLAATAPEAKRVISETDKPKGNGLIPTAALWLLRSDTQLHVVRDDKNLIALTDKRDGSGVKDNLRLLAFDRAFHTVAEARSDASGTARLTPTGEVRYVMALADSGDVAFVDLAHNVGASPVLSPLTAALAVDQYATMPSDKITASLAAHDLHKRKVAVTNSVLQWLRPDQTIYATEPVTLDAAGAAKKTLIAPAQTGLWHLVWKQADGNRLAETPVRVTSNPEAPTLHLLADGKTIASDGGVNLTVRSQTAAQTPVPYSAGHVTLKWIAPDQALSAWKDFHFNDGRTLDDSIKQVGSFLTDAKGEARIHLTLPMPEHAPALRQAQLTLISDPVSGAMDSETLVLPVKPADLVVGIKPATPNGHFAENSLARFDVIAVDGDGHRRALDDLTYTLYEEGRRFEWTQESGKWTYKAQQQKRRIGGGTLSIPADNNARIEWPVTSGLYRLEITDAAGTLLAQQDVNAGWSAADADETTAAPLDIAPLTAPWQASREVKIKFTLPHASLVTATIADDRIRTILHGFYQGGANSIAFTPAADWGSRLLLRIDARDGQNRSSGQLVLPSVTDPAPLPAPHVVGKTSGNKSVAPTNDILIAQQESQQTLAPQQSWTITETKNKKPAAPRVVMAASEPLNNLPALLSAVLTQKLFTTTELAGQSAVLRLWSETLVAAGLLSEAEFRLRQNDILMRLLARQNSDGGFADVPDHAAGSLTATAAALQSLAPLADAAAKTAADQAASWLRHRLENTWFDDRERQERAAAYAALAVAGKLDLASLHYFSDTSATKTMSPLAAAQIAYAFAAINDKDAAKFWLDKIHTDDKGVTADMLPILLANPFFVAQDIQPILEKTAGTVHDKLRALWLRQNRAGSWRVTLGKVEKNQQGVLVLPQTGPTPLSLRNSSDRPIYLAVASVDKNPDAKTPVTRRITTLEGGEVGAHFARGAVYVVTLEGAWAGDHLVVHEDATPALSPITCAIDAPNADGFLGWLAYKTIVAPTACEKSGNGLAILLQRADGNSAPWRIAYLAEATGSDRQKARPAVIQPMPALSRDDKDAPR